MRAESLLDADRTDDEEPLTADARVEVTAGRRAEVLLRFLEPGGLRFVLPPGLAPEAYHSGATTEIALMRPDGRRDSLELGTAAGRLRTLDPVPAGRWRVRLPAEGEPPLLETEVEVPPGSWAEVLLPPSDGRRDAPSGG